MASEDEAIRYFVRRDLLGEVVGPVESIWKLPDPRRIVRRQREDGFWLYPKRRYNPEQNYEFRETYRQLGFLVEKYGFNRGHLTVPYAAE